VQYDLYERSFAWDEEKQEANIKKHKITFIEAATVFDDENARLLIVYHCYRTGDSIIRIISARKANRRERREYGGHIK